MNKYIFNCKNCKNIQRFRRTIRLTNQKLDIKIIGINKALVYPEPSFQNEDSVLTPPEEIDADEALRLMNREEDRQGIRRNP